MAVSLDSFVRIANSTSFSSRDVRVDTNAQTAKLGNFIFSSGAKNNVATMTAFRDALKERYGVFGEHAFDTVLGQRAQLKKSLRACDIKSVLSTLPSIQKKRFINELSRQLDTSPNFRVLSKNLRTEVRDILSRTPFSGVSLKNCSNPAKMAKMVEERINSAIESARSSVNLGKKLDLNIHQLGGRKSVEKEVKSNEDAGLKNLKLIFKEKETSIEDKVKTGKLGVGLRINRSSTNPVLLDKLKTNGVEPGFIYKNDWSLDDTKGMLVDFNSESSLKALEKIKQENPTLASKCEGKPVREQIMLCGRMHPAAMSAVTDYMIEKSMADENSAIYKAFTEKFPHIHPDNWKNQEIGSIKKELFVEIRDTVMNVKPNDADYNKSPIFKHFNDRHIVKLDYNENDRIFIKKSASAGKFMRPQRIVVGRKMGQIYRLNTATTADHSSAGAVTEALANDLTRLAGVPSQELNIMRGQYSDGHPKLMLMAKFADGYTDMENGYIKDGQIVPPNGQRVESLGKYKAFFLVTADRDAVGSRGQNKGFIVKDNGEPGKFFAIDPGHSLESNGRFLEVDDNFSFKDTYGFSTKPRFKNFSVFDDDTRFAKFKGALDLRTLKESGEVDRVFKKYTDTFDPNEKNISEAEKTLRQKITEDIKKKEAEFNDSLAKVLSVADNQLKLYDSLAQDGPRMQENAIETIENLEKLTSPTTWVSPKGEVALKHLQVLPETRKAWRAFAEGDNLVYHCDQPLPKDAQDRLSALAAMAGANLFIDAEGCAKLTIAKSQAETAFQVFSEDNVAKMTHRDEAAARAMGGTGLEEAKNYNPAPPVNTTQAKPAQFELPERLTLTVGNDQLTFPKAHYEAMLANTPAAERPKDLEEFKKILASRIERGRDIINHVTHGHGDRYAATPRNVACLTLALHAATVKKGEILNRGAFSVEDPNGSLYKWLDTSKDLYLRTSTHARHYHHQTVDGHMNMPRGLDIPEGLGGLMGGMRTLHYFTLPETAGQSRRLYLKCETYGIYRSTISKSEEESSRSLGMQTRQSRSGDTAESIKHCLSLATVFTRMGNSEGNRKENVPAAIMNFVTQMQNDLRAAGLNEAATNLAQNVKQGGVRTLMDNFIKILEGNPDTPQLRALTTKFLETMTNYFENTTGEVSNRLGNEVMLDTRDL
ncbi:MAG: hypothetical protein IJU40_01200 [Desulfovibrionaceae bacterium]|nr:hypothetical protein [Desulfovibrionaceae bacterium]